MVKDINLLPVRDQGEAGTCLAFSITAVHEYLHGIKIYLSPSYMYGVLAKYHSHLDGKNGLDFLLVKNFLATLGQVEESASTYEDWLCKASFPILDEITNEKHYLSSLKKIDIEFDEIETLLSQETPIILGIQIDNAFFEVDESGIVSDDGNIYMGTHAVVAIGIRVIDETRYLLIRNSWGNKWALDGHALISEHYLNQRLLCAAKLERPK